jgi:hypothetical protein
MAGVRLEAERNGQGARAPSFSNHNGGANMGAVYQGSGKGHSSSLPHCLFRIYDLREQPQGMTVAKGPKNQKTLQEKTEETEAC